MDDFIKDIISFLQSVKIKSVFKDDVLYIYNLPDNEDCKKLIKLFRYEALHKFNKGLKIKLIK